MLYSMTGFGRAKGSFKSQNVVVEIKSINSKSFDFRSRIASQYQAKEIELRKQLAKELIRGKVDISIQVENLDQADAHINEEAFESYYNQLKSLSGKHNINEGDLLYTITRFPGVIVYKNEEETSETFQEVMSVVNEAIEALVAFRAEEGKALYKDIYSHIEQIQSLLQEVEPNEAERIQKIEARILSSLERVSIDGNYDKNRFEQEMVYFLDKFDLNEEKVRLEQHCVYFLEELEKKTKDKGKKLSFIMQEIGREINTIGSKANSVVIQRIVVQMKNQADKIKEQLANIL